MLYVYIPAVDVVPLISGFEDESAAPKYKHTSSCYILCTHVCTTQYMYIHMYTWLYPCTYDYLHIRVYVCMYVDTFVYLCIHVCLCARMDVLCKYICTV